MKLVRFAVGFVLAVGMSGCAMEDAPGEGTEEAAEAQSKAVDCHDKDAVRAKCTRLCRSRAGFSLDRPTRQQELDIGVTCRCEGGSSLRTICFDAS